LNSNQKAEQGVTLDKARRIAANFAKLNVSHSLLARADEVIE
jgi:hypothetical protein